MGGDKLPDNSTVGFLAALDIATYRRSDMIAPIRKPVECGAEAVSMPARVFDRFWLEKAEVIDTFDGEGCCK